MLKLTLLIGGNSVIACLHDLINNCVCTRRISLTVLSLVRLRICTDPSMEKKFFRAAVGLKQQARDSCQGPVAGQITRFWTVIEGYCSDHQLLTQQKHMGAADSPSLPSFLRSFLPACLPSCLPSFLPPIQDNCLLDDSVGLQMTLLQDSMGLHEPHCHFLSSLRLLQHLLQHLLLHLLTNLDSATTVSFLLIILLI